MCIILINMSIWVKKNHSAILRNSFLKPHWNKFVNIIVEFRKHSSNLHVNPSYVSYATEMFTQNMCLLCMWLNNFNESNLIFLAIFFTNAKMLPSTKLFKTINCPFYEADSDSCSRPYCHFNHVKPGMYQNMFTTHTCLSTTTKKTHWTEDNLTFN